MALLTTDDVLNKKFQPTKFREGYDQDEVDDFLDEVVETLSTLQDENVDLRNKLAEAERRIAELSTGQIPVVEQQAAPFEQQQYNAAVPSQAAAATTEPESATSMLALAQKLHDEYVRSGQEESEQIVAEARVDADRIIKEAEEQHNRVLAQLEQDRSLLERKIEELRNFESEYRSRMRQFLEGILADVSDGRTEATTDI
ncbi:MAG: DivIVA domain-containing protein [Actinomycetaceae bacterium]|nr:DivIVA domain-containing protein [Actinomycetaceae bacterium]